MSSVFQGLSLSRFVGRVGENPGNEVDANKAYVVVVSFFVLKRLKKSFRCLVLTLCCFVSLFRCSVRKQFQIISKKKTKF